MTRGELKKLGRTDATQWMRTAHESQVLKLAADEFQYGDTLTGLIAEGFEVPPSDDVDYSWGFYKYVKGGTLHTLRKKSIGILPSDNWLRKNGYGGLVQAKRERPDLFSHIPQEKRTSKQHARS
jgi:hypothetical protein